MSGSFAELRRVIEAAAPASAAVLGGALPGEVEAAVRELGLERLGGHRADVLLAPRAHDGTLPADRIWRAVDGVLVGLHPGALDVRGAALLALDGTELCAGDIVTAPPPAAPDDGPYEQRDRRFERDLLARLPADLLFPRDPVWPEPPVEPDPAERPAIAYLLSGVPAGGSGGTHSIFQEARGLADLGCPVTIVVGSTATDPRTIYPDAVPTVLVETPDALAEALGPADAIVLTDYPSTGLAADADVCDRPVLHYVQDHEPLFHVEADPRSDAAIMAFAATTGHRQFAKTRWLADLVEHETGAVVDVVRPGIDVSLFHPRGRPEHAGGVRVCAMVRPSTPRRRPVATLRLLARLGRIDDVETVTAFGCTDDELRRVGVEVPEAIINAGRLSRAAVADLMRGHDLFVDCSTYQAFGRTGLEAAACGCVPVMPSIGGAGEWLAPARCGALVAPFDEERMAAAIAELVADRPRLERMARRGTARGAAFPVAAAAASVLALVQAALREGPA